MLLRIEGQFKDYPGLLTAYGINDENKIDPRWRDFLRKAGNYLRPTLPLTNPPAPPLINPLGGKFTMVTNYNAIDGTFDTLWIEPKPATVTFGDNGMTPTNGLAAPTPHVVAIPLAAGDPVHMVSPHGEEKRYCDNMPARVLDNVFQMNTTEHIYCTNAACGYQVELESRYDNMPEWSWAELFDPAYTGDKKLAETGDPLAPDPIIDPLDGTVTALNPDGTPASTHVFNPVKDGLIFCPACRDYQPFATIADSLAAAMAIVPPTPLLGGLPTDINRTLPLEHVLTRTIPTIITNFSATENQLNQITFTWSSAMAYPAAVYELHNSGGLVQDRVHSGVVLEVTGLETYHVVAVNTTIDPATGLEQLNEILSNTDTGEGLVSLTAPSALTDFTATDVEDDQITFSWGDATGYPAPTYDLYDANGLVASDVTSPLTIKDATAEDYHVKAINSEGATDSNVDAGDFV